MPELPEVETVRRDLQRALKGKTIQRISIKRLLRGASKRQFARLRGLTVKSVDRRGKLLFLKLQSGTRLRRSPLYLLVHLMMTGRLLYQRESRRRAIVPYLRATISFTDGSALFFTDIRRFGWMKVVDEEELKTHLARYGIEPLTPPFTVEAFQNVLAARHASLKHVLLDQKAVAGLGNIYVDEICFQASVRPERPASSFSAQEVRTLHRACIAVLRRAVAHRGTTFSTFRDGYGRAGRFSSLLNVYGRMGMQCRRCRTGVITKVHVAGRGTSFCSSCQR